MPSQKSLKVNEKRKPGAYHLTMVRVRRRVFTISQRGSIHPVNPSIKTTVGHQNSRVTK